jgi:hypothetical protein
MTTIDHDLERATRSRPDPERGGFSLLDVPDGWQQGRGAYGGLSIAALVRAIERFAQTPERRLRSLTAELPGPTLVGEATLRVESLRVGSGQSTISARLMQDSEVRALATAVLARPRNAASEDFCELEPPRLRDPADLLPLPPRGPAPIFTQHFEYRTDGPFPYTSGPSARAEGWIRARNPGALRGSALIAALADAWWPASFTRAATPSIVATVAYTLQIVGDGDVDPAAPLAYRAHVWAQQQGWFVEQRELWTRTGELVALNQQTFAVIK